jgi:glutamyl/glutaminyl-tRNA synthetase
VIPVTNASAPYNPFMEARSAMQALPYRGRLAPSPTGLLHMWPRLHILDRLSARAYRTQRHRWRFATKISIRNARRPEFARAMIEDLRWLGIRWQEGPDVGGPFAPYEQSARRALYLETWRRLRDGGFIYPCTCSRKDLATSATAPNEGDDEPLYPGRCRTKIGEAKRYDSPRGVNWRFLVPDNETIAFDDQRQGRQQFIAGQDFGDFVVWRRDDVPAYQLAVVADDAAMQITEVVRGADLLKSTARQLLLIRALGLPVPAYYHCDLVRDEAGARLAKRHDALSLRALREQGHTPQDVLKMCAS